ncbi:MAG: hypothetical protein RSB20_06930, partial [Clostridia bacterium]
MTKINENVYIGNNGIQLKGLRNLTINKLFAGNIKKDVSYSVIDSINNYKLIFIFIGTSYINGSSVI